MNGPHKSENWSSRMGVILAVAGSAVGLGNFLRFPGKAAAYGSGAFMIAYFISLILIGIPICWAEWTLGRHAGQRGYHSSPGIFNLLIRNRWGKFIGVLGVIIPVLIYMYYVYIEAWCAGYAWYFLFTDKLNLGTSVDAYSDFWKTFIGSNQDGFLLAAGQGKVIWFLLAVFAVNFLIIYRGLAKGIEMFCKFAMPALIVLALVILVRVLTLGTPNPNLPDQNLIAGLGSMWNPGDVWGQLANPQLWLEASGQIFFSLSVGFGVIITYASYLRDKDDIVLSGLTASSANEFCEVALGGLITVPAAYVFLGVAGIAGQGTFELGFKVLPLVFSTMPMPALFGFMFFFLLFLAAVTSSLSMLQPGIAFLEEGLGLNRRQSVALLGLLTAIGCLFVVYFSKDIKALDTIDFWVGTVFIFILATVTIILFGWVIGIEKGWAEAHRGAEIRIPSVFKVIMKYISPGYLLVIFGLFVWYNVIGYDAETKTFNPTAYVTDLVGAGSKLTAGDLVDPKALGEQLKTGEDEMSAYLRRRLSDSTLARLDEWTGEAEPSAEAVDTLLAGLNSVIDGDVPLWQEGQLAEVRQLAGVSGLAESESSGAGQAYLNRLMLEAAFPELLSTCRPNTVARLSVMLVLLVTVFFLILISLAGKRWEAERADRAASLDPNSTEP